MFGLCYDLFEGKAMNRELSDTTHDAEKNTHPGIPQNESTAKDENRKQHDDHGSAFCAGSDQEAIPRLFRTGTNAEIGVSLA